MYEKRNSDDKHSHDAMNAMLEKQYQRLQDRIDSMYVDKRDGKVFQAFFDRKSEESHIEQVEILHKIERQQNANRSCLEEGVQILELNLA